MLATWLWITNVLSKIFPAIQFKFYQITAKKYGFANFLQMVVSYFDCITNILGLRIEQVIRMLLSIFYINCR